MKVKAFVGLFVFVASCNCFVVKWSKERRRSHEENEHPGRNFRF